MQVPSDVFFWGGGGGGGSKNIFPWYFGEIQPMANSRDHENHKKSSEFQINILLIIKFLVVYYS